MSKMLDAKKRGEYVDDEEEKRKARLEQKKKPTSQNKSRQVDNVKRTEEDKDLDPELRKVNDEGRRVGWAYRYRIRRKLNHLKQQQIGKFHFNYYSFFEFVFFSKIISNWRII